MTSYDLRTWIPAPLNPAAAFVRERARRVGASPTTHSTRVLRATYPRAVSSLGRLGVLIGQDVRTGNAFAFCPFEMYVPDAPDQLSNPNTVVVGGIGQGKSNLIMSYLARQAVFGRKIRVFSVKPGEYDPWAELTGASIVRVTPGGRTVLNPLDAMMTGDETEDGRIRARRVGILASLFETRAGREARADESSALSLALDACGSRPDLFGILDRLRLPGPNELQALGLGPDGWQQRFYDVTSVIYDLCHGEYAGLFNGPTSAGMNLNADRVVYDLSPLTEAGRYALPMFMAVASGHLSNTLARERGRQIIVVYEEAWRAILHMGVVRAMEESWRLARSYGVQNIIVLHKPSDFDAAGDSGSHVAKLARGLLALTAVKIVYAPEAQERQATGELLALTPDEIDDLAELQKGEALWRIDDRSTIVRHDRSRLEVELFSTDSGMLRAGTVKEAV